MQYNYPPGGSNNGQVLSTNDNISGEGVGYMYDSLKRLIAAQAGSWGESYSYDGFGNLTAKTPTMGSAPALSVSYNAATNQPTSGGYDANGNAPVTGGVWDAENHMVQQTLDGVALNWAYDPSGRRVLQYQQATGRWTFYIYGAGGQLLGQIACTPSGSTCAAQRANVCFGGQLIARMENQSGTMTPRGVVMDRLGTVRAVQTSTGWSSASYFPYGEPKTGTGIDGREQFATYQRDSTASAQDYAGARYYSNVTGRFYSPDPAGFASVNPKTPATWNRYAFNLGDPVNRSDKTGTISCLDWFNALAANGLVDGEVVGNADFDSMFGSCGSEEDAEAANAGADFDPCSITSDSGAYSFMQDIGLSCGGGASFGATGTSTADGADTGGDNPWDTWDDPYPPDVIQPPGDDGVTITSGSGGGGAGMSLCVRNALIKGAITTGLDALGALPQGGLISAAFSPFHGAAGISNGRDIQKALGLAGGIITVGAAGNDLSSSTGTSGTLAGASTGLGAAGIAEAFGFAKTVGLELPGLGQVIAGLSVAVDIYGTYRDLQECH